MLSMLKWWQVWTKIQEEQTTRPGAGCGKWRERVCLEVSPMKTSGEQKHPLRTSGGATWLVHMTPPPCDPTPPWWSPSSPYSWHDQISVEPWCRVLCRILTQGLGGGSPVGLGEANTWVLTRWGAYPMSCPCEKAEEAGRWCGFCTQGAESCRHTGRCLWCVPSSPSLWLVQGKANQLVLQDFTRRERLCLASGIPSWGGGSLAWSVVPASLNGSYPLLSHPFFWALLMGWWHHLSQSGSFSGYFNLGQEGTRLSTPRSKGDETWVEGGNRSRAEELIHVTKIWENQGNKREVVRRKGGVEGKSGLVAFESLKSNVQDPDRLLPFPTHMWQFRPIFIAWVRHNGSALLYKNSQ